MKDQALIYIAKNVTDWPYGATLVYPDPDGEIRFVNDSPSDFYPDAREPGHRRGYAFLSDEKHYSERQWAAARKELMGE